MPFSLSYIWSKEYSIIIDTASNIAIQSLPKPFSGHKPDLGLVGSEQVLGSAKISFHCDFLLLSLSGHTYIVAWSCQRSHSGTR